MKKYLTLITLAIIIIAAPLTTPFAYAKPEPTTVTADIDGWVTDLGTQEYEIEGKGGAYLGLPVIVDPKISFELEATVIDDDVTGEMEITVKGKSDSGKVKLEVEIPVVDGDPVYGCLDLITYEPIVCPPRPWPDNVIPYLELENGDFIPIVFFGAGEATLEIGETEEAFPVFVIVDTSTAQHPFEGDGNTGQVNIIEASGLFALSVDVKEFDVEYIGVETMGVVSGDLMGIMTQTVESKEDHVKDVQKDKGEVSFALYDGSSMTGKFKGESVQVPPLYLYYSTGKFKTEGDLKLKGTYETIWTLPLFFTSTFTATVKN